MLGVDPVLVTAIAFAFGALVPLSPAQGLMAAGCVLALLSRRVPLAFCGCLTVVFGLSAWRAQGELERFEQRWLAVKEVLPGLERCAGAGVVDVSPALLGGTLGFSARFDALECETQRFEGPLRVRLYGAPEDVVRGDRVEVVAQLGAVRLFRNADLPDPRPAASRAGNVLSGGVLSLERVEEGRGLFALIDRARAHARRRIDATFSGKAANLSRALVLGENDLDAEDAAAFRLSGLAHLLAVSGTHLVFAVIALVRALRAILACIYPIASRSDVGRLAAAAGLVLALLYADFAGGSGSAWRAAWMLSAAFAARALDRRPSAGRSVGFSILVGAVLDPLVVFDISFLLSLAATSGLLLIGRPLSRKIRRIRNRVARFLTEAFATTVSAMIPCAPLLSVLGPSLTLAGIAANVVAGPFGEVVALPLCLLHPLSTPFPFLERGLALVGSGALLVVGWLAHLSADATYLAVNVPPASSFHFAVMAVGGSGFLLAGKSYKRSWIAATALALVIAELAAVRAGDSKGQLRVSALDIGQGDATLVDFPDGKVMLIDAGGFVGVPVDPGERVVAPVLRARRRGRVDVAVLSHPHPDHFGGLGAALASVEVGEFWDTGQGIAEGAMPPYAALLAGLRARGVPILGPRELCGRPREFGGATLRVLAPCPSFTPGINANDNSFVIRVEYGERSVLLTGDAEHHQEVALVARYGSALRADLLKVGHHGSRTSTSEEFLAAVQPAVATISSGVRNRFGHPHAETLQTLTRAGVQILRLDRVGSVTWSTDGERTRIRVFNRGPVSQVPRSPKTQ